ncbi:MAG: iron-sulfur cluster carrier protein MrpORP [Eubacteriales bacterium]|nr:iron-sulfur cluster carrier protein MrpORP [Eubacteriales bacterium]
MSEKTDNRKTDMLVENHPLNQIKRTVAVLSGKGGVGKSLITALLAVYMQRTGKYRVGVMDADITGPSIPKLFGADDFRPKATDQGMFPVRTHSDIQLMSINLLLESPDAPVLWRGPLLGNVIKQFWNEVIWGDLDFMFLDMPPGTGDVPLTVFQSLPLDGIIIVASPQELVSMIVKKAINMAQMMSIPIIGLIENMSHTVCPHCGKEIALFGESHTEDVAKQFNIPFLGKMPIDPDLARLSDEGHIERIHKYYLNDALAALEKMPVHGGISYAERECAELEQKESIRNEENNNEQKENMNSEDKIMRIAVAAEAGVVSQHFGHCEGFTIVDVQDNKPVKEEFLANPGHKPGLLPKLLHEKKVNVVIAGGMGGGAIELFNENCIDVITGAEGEVAAVIDQYLAGDLVSSGSVCHEHSHSDSCGGH